MLEVVVGVCDDRAAPGEVQSEAWIRQWARRRSLSTTRKATSSERHGTNAQKLWPGRTELFELDKKHCRDVILTKRLEKQWISWCQRSGSRSNSWWTTNDWCSRSVHGCTTNDGVVGDNPELEEGDAERRKRHLC